MELNLNLERETILECIYIRGRCHWVGEIKRTHFIHRALILLMRRFIKIMESPHMLEL